MIKIIGLTTFLIFFQFAQAAGFDHNHTSWDKILKSNVVDKPYSSTFSYKALKKNTQVLDKYLFTLSAVKKSEFDKYSEKQRLAFLINAYNAFTVKLILDNYPLKSIKDIGSIFTNAWKQEFFTLFGKKSHLNNIEHDMIRKSFNEPRIHFAVVCASIGCPALKNEAFTATKLEAQLEASALKFLGDKNRNRYNVKNNELELSKIFKWYGDDFNKTYGSFEKFIIKRMPNGPKNNKDTKDIDVEFLSYNWNLNE